MTLIMQNRAGKADRVRDGYFYKSLFATLFLYAAILGLLIVFIVLTWPVGILFILFMVIYSLSKFYGLFEKRRSTGRRKDQE